MCAIEKKDREDFFFFFFGKFGKIGIGKLESMWGEFVIKGESNRSGVETPTCCLHQVAYILSAIIAT